MRVVVILGAGAVFSGGFGIEFFGVGVLEVDLLLALFEFAELVLDLGSLVYVVVGVERVFEHGLVLLHHVEEFLFLLELS